MSLEKVKSQGVVDTDTGKEGWGQFWVDLKCQEEALILPLFWYGEGLGVWECHNQSGFLGQSISFGRLLSVCQTVF